ncbi:MAG: hypothetical protein ACE5E7_15540 [Anaerolineae bacterium]
MPEETAEWDYCQIEVLVVDDGRDPARAGNKLMWVQFLARAAGPNGSYIAGKSSKVPLANILGSTFAPQQSNIGHDSILRILLHALQKEGWELLRFRGNEWWERRLRRPTRPKKAIARKLRSLFRAR